MLTIFAVCFSNQIKKPPATKDSFVKSGIFLTSFSFVSAGQNAVILYHVHALLREPGNLTVQSVEKIHQFIDPLFRHLILGNHIHMVCIRFERNGKRCFGTISIFGKFYLLPFFAAAHPSVRTDRDHIVSGGASADQIHADHTIDEKPDCCNGSGNSKEEIAPLETIDRHINDQTNGKDSKQTRDPERSLVPLGQQTVQPVSGFFYGKMIIDIHKIPLSYKLISLYLIFIRLQAKADSSLMPIPLLRMQLSFRFFSSAVILCSRTGSAF